MSIFFCAIVLFLMLLILKFKQTIKKVYEEIDNKKTAIINDEKYYWGADNKHYYIKNDKEIIIKQNEYNDTCYYDAKTGECIFNQSDEKRIKIKKNLISTAKKQGLKYISLPYVYKYIENKKIKFLPENIELSTMQPYQLGYIPIAGYGHVIRKAPPIDLKKYYSYEYKNDETKWEEWNIIDKETYSQISGKPYYEYNIIYNYDLNNIKGD